MAFLKNVAKIVTGGLGFQTLYKKYRKGRAEDKANEKNVKDQQNLAKKREERAHRLQKPASKQQRHIIEGKDAIPTDIRELNKQLQQAGEGSEQFYQPIQNQAVRNFNQQTVPNLLTQYGQGSKSSSALNQALGSAASQLHENLAANFANMKQQQAMGVFNASNANRAQNIANQSNASQVALGSPSAYQPYMGGPSNQSQFWNKALPIAGGVAGGIAGGPGGIVPGMQAGTAIGQVVT